MKYVGVDISKETFDTFNDELTLLYFANRNVKQEILITP
jgi:hypothetical protein